MFGHPECRDKAWDKYQAEQKQRERIEIVKTAMRELGAELGEAKYQLGLQAVRKMSREERQAAIDACHPTTLETEEAMAADALAMDLLHGRHDKRDIVNLIRWTLMGCPIPTNPN